MKRLSLQRLPALLLLIAVAGGTALVGWSGRTSAAVISGVSPNGGVLSVRGRNAALDIGYAANDATAGASLSLTLESATSGIPLTPSGVPVLAAQVDVGGGRIVTFTDLPPTSTLRSAALRAGVDYSMYSFVGGKPVGVPYDAGMPLEGSLRFPSPLRNLSLSPGTPLLIVVVAGAKIAHEPAAMTTMPLAAGGATLSLPEYASFGGSLDYAANDGRRNNLTLVNTGSLNATNALVPPLEKTLLFLELHVDGTRAVSFAPTVSGPGLMFASALPNLRLHSPLLAPGVVYDAFVFAGGQLVETGSAAASASGALTLPSPLSDVRVAPGMPIVIELATALASPQSTLDESTGEPSLPEKNNTQKLAPAGGTIRAISYGGFQGTFPYAPNNAPSGVTLTLTNSGQYDQFNAPTPPGTTALLFLAAQVTVYASELNVVRVRHLWPRGIVQPPLTRADKKVLSSIALQGKRRPEQYVSTGFQTGPTPGEEGAPSGSSDR